MNAIQILGQKTVVTDPQDSRNTIRPLLEEAGFSLDYERYSRTLSVSDGKEELVRIVGVKGFQDFKRFSRETQQFPYMIAGGDIIAETAITKMPRVETGVSPAGEDYIMKTGIALRRILDLQLGKCGLQYLTAPEFSSLNLEDIDAVFTKYPIFFKAMVDSILGKDNFSGEIVYSDSPDTTLASILAIQKAKKESWDTGIQDRKIFGKAEFLGDGRGQKYPEKSLAAWEIVETGKSAEELGLVSSQKELDISISTGIYSQNYFGNDVFQPQMKQFISRIQGVLNIK